MFNGLLTVGGSVLNDLLQYLAVDIVRFYGKAWRVVSFSLLLVSWFECWIGACVCVLGYHSG